MEKIVSNSKGICPVCGADDLVPGCTDFVGMESILYDLTCNKCGASITEEYELKYTKSIVDTE